MFERSDGRRVRNEHQRSATRHYVVEIFRLRDVFEVAQYTEYCEPSEQRRERVHQANDHSVPEHIMNHYSVLYRQYKVRNF